jgi:putative transposase
MSARRHSAMHGPFLEIQVGNYASLDDMPCKIQRILSPDSVVVQFVEGLETKRVNPNCLRPVETCESAEVPGAEGAESKDKKKHTSEIAEITDDDWAEATRCLAVIQPLIGKLGRTRADVAAAAKAANVQTSTVYRWINNYQLTGHLSGLIKQPRGRKPGSTYLTDDQERIINDLIATYEDPQSLRPSDVIEDINTEFDAQGVARPHPNTIRNRLAAIPLKRQMETRGQSEAARQRFEPRPGQFPSGTFPLECVQMDHVKLNILVVDEVTRAPIKKRPWLTLAIDCYSRVIVGYYLSLDSPSAFGTGVCIYMAICPKNELLTRLDLPGEWPVQGKMRKIHTDNAKEFKGHLLQRGCAENRIDLELRPKKRPHYGAYIERMVGNVNRMIHRLPGTTHESPKTSPDYDPAEESAYTMATLEKEIVDWIVNRYHVQKHSELNTTPISKYERGLLGDRNTPGVGLPPVPVDREKLRIDFLPYETRAIHPYGVEIGRMYYHEVLNRWIGAPDARDPKKKRKFIFHYDPRTIRSILFWDPEVHEHYEIPIKDTTWPDISWAEYNEAAKTLSKQGDEDVDEQRIKDYVSRRKIRQQTEVEKTKLSRNAQKGDQSGGTEKTPPATVPPSKANTAPGSTASAAIPKQPAEQTPADLLAALCAEPERTYD